MYNNVDRILMSMQIKIFEFIFLTKLYNFEGSEKCEFWVTLNDLGVLLISVKSDLKLNKCFSKFIY